MNETRKALFGPKAPLLELKELTAPKSGIFRCRLIYTKEIEKIEFFPYFKKPIFEIELWERDFEYAFKFLDRSKLNAAKKKLKKEILFFGKNENVEDITIANVAFYYKGEWLSPKKPLLFGTTLMKLVEEKKVRLAEIELKEIKRFEKMAIMNAMRGFEELKSVKIAKGKRCYMKY